MPRTQDGTAYALLMVTENDRDALALARRAIAFAERHGWNPGHSDPDAAAICLDRLTEDFDMRANDSA